MKFLPIKNHSRTITPEDEAAIAGAMCLITVIFDDKTDPTSAMNTKAFQDTRATLLDEYVTVNPPAEEKELGNLKLWMGSWNVGNAPPQEDLSSWLPLGSDIYVIGAQECKYEARSGYKSCLDDWVKTLTKHFGSDYELVDVCSMWQIRSVIFATKSYARLIHSVYHAQEASGIGGVMGNKGGTAIAFYIRNTSFCFVNAHLAAHQHKVLKRNDDVREIIEGINMTSKAKPSGLHTSKLHITNQYDHIFWGGDLNYRLDYGVLAETQDKTPDEKTFNEMVQLVTEEQWDTLWAADQLDAQMKQNNVFCGFVEGKYNFAPTFKVLRETELKYLEQRAPSYCDRILWKSHPVKAADVVQTQFGPAIPVGSSDHKPVFAAFDITLRPPQRGVDRNLGACSLIITELKCASLRPMDRVKGNGGTCDPIVEIRSQSMASRWETPAKKNTLDPEWTAAELKEIPLLINRPEALNIARLIVRVVDKDLVRKEYVGACFFPIGEATNGDETPFELNLTYGGKPAGTVSGKFRLKWTK